MTSIEIDHNKYRQKLLGLAIGSLIFYILYDYFSLLSTFWGPGWDFTSGCDAAYTFFRGANPYRAQEYNFSPLPFTYLPFWLPIHGALCKLIFISDMRETYIYFPLYFSLLFLAIYCAVKRMKLEKLDAYLFAFLILTGLGGFCWALRSGNVAVFEGIFLITAISFLFSSSQPKNRNDIWYFAIFFGLFVSLKTATCVFIIVFLLLPVSLVRRIQLCLIAACIGLIPVFYSILFYSDLLPSYFLTITGRMGGNVDPNLSNPSLFWFFNNIFRNGVDIEQLPRFILSGALVVLTVIGGGLLIVVLGETKTIELKSIISKFGRDRYNAVLLAIIIIQLINPRAKEYTYIIPAVAFSFLIIRMKASANEKLFLTAVLSLPVLLNHPRLPDDHIFSYAQLFACLLLYLIFVARFYSIKTFRNSSLHI